MTAASTSPVYPIPGREARVQFALTESGSNYVRVWVTDAPEGSELKGRLDRAGVTRSLVYEGDTAEEWGFEPDAGGCYVLVAQEYTLGASSHGGSYEGDPNGTPSQTKVGAESALSLYIGQKMVAQMGAGGDIADLSLYVFNDTIRPTTNDVHGEVTPSIGNPASDSARTASVDSDVLTALSDLSNVAVSTAIGDVSSISSDIINNYNAHLTQGGVHNSNDTDNPVDSGFTGAQNPDTLPSTVTEILSKVRRHYKNDDGSGAGSATLPYHVPFDQEDESLFTAVGAIADAYRSLADVWRSYEAHRVNTTVHTSADSANDLAALPKLLVLHREFFESLAALNPTVPQTQSSGAVLLITQTGAREY